MRTKTEDKNEKTSPDKGVNVHELLGPKYTKMKVSANGTLGRIEKGWEVDALMRYTIGEMLSNLKEMSKRFYDGDVKAVDEFLQLYCLDENRP